MAKVTQIYSKPEESRYSGGNSLSDFIRRLSTRPLAKGAARWATPVRFLEGWH